MNECSQCHREFDFDNDGGIEVRQKVTAGVVDSWFYCSVCCENNVVRVMVPVDESKVVDW